MKLVGYDIDGTLTGLEGLEGSVVISGRTFAEYDKFARSLAARVPVYIRGCGAYGDRQHAAQFKAMMIRFLGVTEYHEDDLFQAEIIMDLVPEVSLVLHG